MNGGDGNDLLYDIIGGSTHTGGAGFDNIIANVGGDFISGDAGADILSGDNGAGVTSGRDILLADAQDVQILTDGNDIVTGTFLFQWFNS